MRSKNWKTYGFEFLCIFIAVILAFALNNWNEGRKSRIAENKILTEIYYGLEKDLEDLHLNEIGHERGIRAVNFFRDVLDNKPVSNDSLMSHYMNLTRDFVSIQNTSGYETLKSRGLELIEDDSLRTKIISLYEYNYNTLRKLEEEYFEMQFQENYFKEINLAVAPHFEFDENNMLSGMNTPLTISDEDQKILLTYLWKIQVNRNFILNYYAAVEGEILDVRNDIQNQLQLVAEN